MAKYCQSGHIDCDNGFWESGWVPAPAAAVVFFPLFTLSHELRAIPKHQNCKIDGPMDGHWWRYKINLSSHCESKFKQTMWPTYSVTRCVVARCIQYLPIFKNAKLLNCEKVIFCQKLNKPTRNSWAKSWPVRSPGHTAYLLLTRYTLTRTFCAYPPEWGQCD